VKERRVDQFCLLKKKGVFATAGQRRKKTLQKGKRRPAANFKGRKEILAFSLKFQIDRPKKKDVPRGDDVQ